MKLTEQHVSDEVLTSYIKFYEIRKKEKVSIIQDEAMLLALLELKQRRAEDRQREFDNVKA